MFDENSLITHADANDIGVPDDLTAGTAPNAPEITAHVERVAQGCSDVANITGNSERQVNDLATAKRIIDIELARKGALDSEHPLSTYVKTLFSRIYAGNDIEIIVSPSEGEPNAMATFNKKIFLSKELVRLCETEEELLFVLHHELNHILAGHFGTQRKAIKSLFSYIGEERMKEVADADMSSLFDLGQKGINVMGAFTFMEKIQKWEGKKAQSISLSHGNITERLILLKAVLKSKDFKNLKPEQTPIPDEIKQPGNFIDTYGFPVQREMVQPDLRHEIRDRVVEKMTLTELVVNLMDLTDSVASKEDEAGKAICNYIEKNKKLCRKMRKLIAEKLEKEGKLSAVHTETLLALISRLMLVYRHSFSLATFENMGKSPSALKIVKTSTAIKKIIDDEQTGFYGGNDFDANIAEMGELEIGEPGKLLDYLLPKRMHIFDTEQLRNLLYGGETAHIENIFSSLVRGKAQPPKLENSEEEMEIVFTEELAIQFHTVTVFDLEKVNVGNLTISDAAKGVCYSISGRNKPYNEKDLECVFSKLEQVIPNERIFGAHFLVKHLEKYPLNKDGFSKRKELLVRKLFHEYTRIVTKIHGKALITEVGILQGLQDANKASFLAAFSFLQGEKQSPEDLRILVKSLDDIFTSEQKDVFVSRYIKLSNISKSTDFKVLLAICKGIDRCGESARALYMRFIESRQKQMSFETLSALESELTLFEEINNITHTSEAQTGKLFYAFLATRKWTMSTMEECLILLRLCYLCGDPVKKSMLLKKTWNRIIEIHRANGLSTADLFKMLPVNANIPYDILEEIIETDAQTSEDFESAIAYVKTPREQQEVIGKFIATQYGIEIWVSGEKMKFLKALLDPESDASLKDRIFSGWVQNYYYQDGWKSIHERKSCPYDIYPQQILNSMKMMDDQQKHALTHMLLVGRNGVVSDKANIDEFIDYFFDKFVEEPIDENDEIFINEAKKIIKLSAGKSKAEDIYFLLSRLISKRILKAPESGWEKINSVKAFETWLQEKTELTTEKINQIIETSIYGKKTEDDYLNIHETEYLFENSPEKSPAKIDSLGLLVEIAQSMGSIGIRFLQLMGLYIKVPPKYSEAFKKVYSDIRGQYKITAFDTLRNNFAESVLQNLRLGTRAGGGSILTVYPFETDNLSGIVKIVNPNVLTEMETIFRVLEVTFQELIEEDSEKYGPLLMMLHIIKKWVLADVNLAAHQEQDTLFRKNNSGEKSSGGVFESSVPSVIHYGDKLIMEEKIAGKTLQYCDRTPEEVSDIIGLIRNQLLAQILHGIEHSDIHPGNFIVSDDGRVHWLDRTFLLTLKPQEQALLVESAMCDTPAERVRTFVKNILKWPENESLTEEKKTAVVCRMEEIVKEDLKENESPLDVTRKVLVELHKMGINIPFNIIMTLKNLLSIEMMDEQLGERGTH